MRLVVVDKPRSALALSRLYLYSLRKRSVLTQEAHISKLKEGVDAGGDASLQNGLDMAVASLKSVPPYGHREVRSLLTIRMGGDIGTMLVFIIVADLNLFTP